MFTRADTLPLSIAAATALAAGLGFGAWAGPPQALSRPVVHGEVQPVYADDPNLALYKQVIAEQGVTPAPPYVVASYVPPPARAPVFVDEAAALDAELAREAAAFEARSRAWEAERTAWLEARRAADEARRPLPTAFALAPQPEQATAAPADTETPDDQPPDETPRG
jgi:hypothetical protein